MTEAGHARTLLAFSLVWAGLAVMSALLWVWDLYSGDPSRWPVAVVMSAGIAIIAIILGVLYQHSKRSQF